MPSEPQGLGQLRQAAKRVSGKTKYPIRNFEQLAEALGGEDATVDLLGRKHTVREGRQLVPRDYFPIESEEDLTAKIANLDLMRADSPLRQSEMGTEEPPSADRSPPTEQEHGRPARRNDGPSVAKGVR